MMKKFLGLLFTVCLVLGLSVWQHTQVNAKYHNFSVEKRVIHKADLPVKLSNGLQLVTMVKHRNAEHIKFQLTITSPYDNVAFKTNDFAIALNTNNRGRDFTDFDPSVTKINGQEKNTLDAGQNIVEITAGNDPASPEATLFYLGKHLNGAYSQLEFID